MELIVRNPWGPKDKKVCIVRYGAWGDAIIVSRVFRKYKEEGWHVTLNCTEKCFEILKSNPHIDAYIIQASNEIPINDLGEHWKKMEKQFTKFVNLTGSIETALLIGPSQKEYTWTAEKLRKKCGKNYYDYTMECAGFKKDKGLVGELHFSRQEENFAKKLRKKHKGFFVVWCLSGSSVHKIYPYAGNVIHAMAEGIPEAKIILIGEGGCKGLVEKHKNIIDRCGDFGIRESCALTKFADLVVTPETSILNAAGCFDTPKVALLSHSSEENMTKHFRNCYPVHADVPCYPCHKLHYSKDTCPVNEETGFPLCTGLLKPDKVLEPIEKVYIKWRNKNVNPNTTN